MPQNTLSSKLRNQNSNLSKFILKALVQLRNILVLSGQYGGKFVVGDDSELKVLRLNRKSSLGQKGDLVYLPSDETICNFVRLRGSWELDDCQFLVSEITRHTNRGTQSQDTLFLDIGANSGLISRQVRNLLGKEISMILVEPIPMHVEAIRLNLEEFHLEQNVSIIQGALGDIDGVAEIYIQESNRGNTSLLHEAIMKHQSKAMGINLIDTEKFSNEKLDKFKNIVLKSDTQGFDAKILSRIPPKAWSSINSAVIEVWALPEVELSDIVRLIGIWRDLGKFKFYSSSNTSIELTLEEIELLWSSKSGKSMNLRLVSSGLN
jgi:FkbM family methyltransferase